MELERKLKVRKLREKQQIHESEPEVNLMDLPTEVLDMVANFVPRKDLKNFGLTNKKCQQIFKQIYYKYLDLRKCLKVDEKKILEAVKNVNYISLTLNECHWLSSKTVLELVSKDSVRELKLFDCQCTPEVIDAIAKLNLTSLAFSMNKYWIDFFVSNELNSIPRLKGLKKLKILHLSCKQSGLLVSHVSRYVLRHCPNLVYLKLFTYPDQNSYFGDHLMENATHKVFRPRKIPTPVPKLETLILDVDENDEENISKDVFNLVKLILNRKESPLKRIYLGKQTAKAFSSGILSSKNITYEKTKTLCLSYQEQFNCHPILDFLYVPGFTSSVDSMLKAPNCKRIEMDCLILDDFDLIAHKVIESGNTSVEEISFRGCDFDGIKFICPPLLKIANFCPLINFLDMSNADWNNSANNNPEMMECLCSFTNLRTLYLSPDMLSYASNFAKLNLKLLFRKLANNCKLIEKLGLIHTHDHGQVPQEVLSQIKFFENLQELHLANFHTTGTELALPEIAQSCARLTQLYITNVYNEELNSAELPWEQILIHIKQIKHLSINQNFKITNEFVDCLVECTQLEKLFLSPIYSDEDEVNQYFIDNLRKLTKLKVFVTESSPRIFDYFGSAINKIEETKRPLFCRYCFFEEKTDVPLAHRHLIQYEHFQ